MAYVNVPKDLTKVKTKVLFNLTKRQLICFGSGALIGVPLFFLLKGSIGTSPAAMVMMVVMIPAMLFAMRLAWTLADLAGRISPTEQDVHQGIEMRTRVS